MNNDYLYHHGIKGMRWGVRRYRNYDGTLTAAGKRRLNMSGENRTYSQRTHAENEDLSNRINKAVGTDYAVASKAINAGSSASRSASSALSKTSRMKKEKIFNQENDISKLSNEELQKRVNRMNLEKQYKNLKVEQIALGRDRASDYLNIAGDVLASAASVATIAGMIYLLK